jgi:hypothetical protein
MRFHSALLASVLLAVGAASSSAGTVNVSFIGADHYWDAGNLSSDESPNLQSLARHLQRLGRDQLAPDRVLNIEVLQVALAGTRSRTIGASFRTLNGGADWPRILLRYNLQAPGQPAISGQEWVVDLDYLHGLTGARNSDSLFYEKRMLGAWFRTRFVEHQPAPG